MIVCLARLVPAADKQSYANIHKGKAPDGAYTGSSILTRLRFLLFRQFPEHG